MKIGMTINGYYSDYLEKIANLNGISKTEVCSLIVENFLSYNLNLNKFPIFKKNVSIVFAKENKLEGALFSEVPSDPEPSMSRDQILASLSDNED